jgi:hypothetical protein
MVTRSPASTLWRRVLVCGAWTSGETRIRSLLPCCDFSRLLSASTGTRPMEPARRHWWPRSSWARVSALPQKRPLRVFLLFRGLARLVGQDWLPQPSQRSAPCLALPRSIRSTNPSLLGRLRVRSKKLVRIGKEVDRLDQDEGASLERDQPVEYERDDLGADIEYLATFPQAATASDLGLTERGWRKIVLTRPTSKPTTVERLRETAASYRVGSRR